MRSCGRRAPGAARHLAIHLEVVAHHAVAAEPRRAPLAHDASIERAHAPDGLVFRGLVVGEEPGDAGLHDLGHGPARPSDDRRSARHRLDHRETERLREVDEVYERERASEQLVTIARAYRPDIPDALV